MLQDEFVLIIHIFVFVTMLLMVLLLCTAARFKGVSSYAAVFVLFTTFPNFFYHICGHFNWDEIAVVVAPMAYSANLALMPFLLLLSHRAFNPSYSFRLYGLLHFLPAIVFACVVVATVTMMTSEDFRDFLTTDTVGIRSALIRMNHAIVIIQFVLYFYYIFTYLHKVKRYITEYMSPSELANKVWVPRFITFMGIAVIAALIEYFFDPFKSFRLFYLINLMATGYLLYAELKVSFVIRHSQEPTPPFISDAQIELMATAETKQQLSEDDLVKLKKYAIVIEDYLRTSEAYVNPNLTLKDVASATGISSKNLSKAINLILDKSFFDLVNGLRVDKSKALLVSKKEKGLTLETIAEQCGFNSQVTYCNAFKRAMGVTTNKWLKQVRGESCA
ncbi:MAG: helix-turn-helix domain-containing protein [Bacteroidales bacterium]|nr:helix-turn-helix domain-containing protein [Bacteroidales bacterium]